MALPVLAQFRPELILISAGFDAHMNDPLAGMRLTGPFFGHLTAAIVKVADECCDGRVVAVTEGGYDSTALAESLRAAIRALEGEPTGARRSNRRGAPRRGDGQGRAPASERSLEAIIKVAFGSSGSWRVGLPSLGPDPKARQPVSPIPMPDYHPQELDKKWQQKWAAARAFEVEVDRSKPKFYCLEMFAYPSGHAHVGHVRNYIIGDVMARTKRMRGYNVLHPFGWDAFGLPAENAAIKNGIHPEVSTRGNIAHMKGQLQRLGISYAWERELATCDAEYYKWNQWLFIRMFERGLAYRRKSSVNWCPVDNTVLANEQVVDGKCWRCDTPVETRDLEQWFFRITAYADELLDATDSADPVARKSSDDAAELDRAVGRRARQVPAGGRPRRRRSRSSRPGSTRSTAPRSCCSGPSTRSCRRLRTSRHDPAALKQKAQAFRLQDRAARISGEIEKDGFDTGFRAINPFTGQPVPIWVANFVLGEYGTGAVMAVPAHDERDFEFARKFNLPIRVVVTPDGKPASADVADGGRVRLRPARGLRRVLGPDLGRGAQEDDRRGQGRAASAKGRFSTG